jgi:hypothetical protein
LTQAPCARLQNGAPKARRRAQAMETAPEFTMARKLHFPCALDKHTHARRACMPENAA